MRYLIGWLLNLTRFYVDAPGSAGAPPTSPAAPAAPAAPAGGAPSAPAAPPSGAPVVKSEDGDKSFTIPSNMADASSPAKPAGTPSDGMAKINLKELIPEEFRSKPYMKELLEKNDFVGLIKKLDGAQKLLGAKIPGGATASEIGAHIKEMKIEGLPETQAAKFQDMFYKAGLSKDQVTAVMNGLKAIGSETMEDDAKEKAASAEKINAEFEALSAKTFGDRQDKVLSTTRHFLTKYAPPEFREKMKEASNETLILLSSVVDGLVRDYVSEEIPTGADVSKAPNTLTKDQAYDKMVELYSDPAARNAFDPRHATVMAQIENLKKFL